MIITGRATPEGTRAHLKHGVPWSRVLGKTALATGALGFGTYRMDRGNPAHEAALRHVFQGGCVNLIDTASNYTGGQSEELIGHVLGDEIRQGRLSREGLILVTKAGYLTDALLQRARDGAVPSDSISQLGEDHWHSFHPSVLDAAIQQSITRLGVECIDIFLLHNPEYFLIERQGTDSGSVRTEFYDRIAEAFECLEKWVEAGVLGAYGVSSNTLGFGPEAPTGVSSVELQRTAHRVAGERHHLRVVQCPLNVFETLALPEIEETQLAVLTNRPLNAIENGTVYRLAESYSMREAMTFRERARELRRLENSFKAKFQSRCASVDARRVFFANELGHGLTRFPSRVSLDDYMIYNHTPLLRSTFECLDKLLGNQPGYLSWRDSYWRALRVFVEAATAQLEQRDLQKIAPICEQVFGDLPTQLEEASLAQKAWWYCVSRPGVTTALAGAREPKYVQEMHRLAELWRQ